MLLTRLLIEHPEALATIVRSTPAWVGGLFVFLIALGLSAARTRQLPRSRLILLPVAMAGLALWGVWAAFGASGELPALLALWLLCAALMLYATRTQRAPRGTRFQPATARFVLPGSWVPMALILAVFLMKYLIGVQLAMEPRLAHELGFALGVTALYGALSGLFAARTLRVLRVAREEAAPALSQAKGKT
ncbi:MAG: hypothetical protein AMXMBFR78_17660 [Rubrivivax sp.]|jgi:hypothetical protein